MKKLKRIILLSIIALIITVNVRQGNYVLANNTDNDYADINPIASNYISTNSAVIYKANNLIYIDYTMIAHCDKLEIDIELQSYEYGNWYTIKSWKDSATNGSIVNTVTYATYEGKLYRATVTFKAYFAGKVVETISKTVSY